MKVLVEDLGRRFMRRTLYRIGPPVDSAGCDTRIYKATGNVMAPTINNGDRMFVGPVRKPIQRGDIVIIDMPKAPGKAFVTRVVGLPSETIEIRSGRVIVDGAPIDEPYVDDANKSTENFGPGPVPTGRYFVLGDNRRTVMSGRAWGHVREADVTGRVRGF